MGVRIRSIRLQTKLSEGHREVLLTGRDFEGLYDAVVGLGPEMARQHWLEYSDELVADWVQRKPFSRPWAWWQWDSPQPRREVREGKGIVAVFNHPDWPDAREGYSWGKPTGYAYTTDSDTPRFGCPSDDDLPQYESERDYLMRLNLLTTTEKKLLQRSIGNA